MKTHLKKKMVAGLLSAIVSLNALAQNNYYPAAAKVGLDVPSSSTTLYSPLQVGVENFKLNMGYTGVGPYVGFNSGFDGFNWNLYSIDDDGDYGGAAIAMDEDGSLMFITKSVSAQATNVAINNTNFFAAQRMRIDPNGNVDIFGSNANLYVENRVLVGTYTPPSIGPSGGYKFGVLGNANINGSVVIGDASTITAGGTSPGVPFSTNYRLFVDGGIIGERVKVAIKTTTNWSDFVFDKSYRLMPLKEVEKFVSENKHLPDVPSAEQMVENGLDVATMDAKLLQKIEELTLYMIDLNKKVEELKEENEELKRKISQD